MDSHPPLPQKRDHTHTQEGGEGSAGAAGEAGEIPSELLQALSGGEAPDMMKALGDVLSGLSPDDMPKTAEDLEQVAKLKKDIRETLGDVCTHTRTHYPPSPPTGALRDAGLDGPDD